MSTEMSEGVATMPATSGVKLTFTAKGLCQPEITTRYASAAEAMEHAVADTFKLFDQVEMEANRRQITLVTQS